jgi:pimeloyl-ACP methyl ester carboxylesterase
LRDRAVKEKWSEDYLKLALKQMKDTREKAKRTRHDWGFILGKRCYFKNIRDEDVIKPAEVIAKINSPILILHGKNDFDVPVESAGNLDKALASYGTMKHTITYFDYLGHFFGKLINDGASKMHYQTDKAVSLAIKAWLDAQ